MKTTRALLTFPYTATELAQTPYAPDWLVSRYGFMTDKSKQPLYWVQGELAEADALGKSFFWIGVNPFRNWRYDMSKAVFCDRF